MIELKDWVIIALGFQIGLGIIIGVSLGVVIFGCIEKLRK